MADAHGDDHRRRRHGGDHPLGERIRPEEGVRWRDLPAEQHIATVVLLVGLAVVVFLRAG
ncbi:hypothetical protein [Streptomyces afghaniensis]|uniref:hypothetical protein n=1 Tax=Streptomyces afghaniensis TaxID=66865 RepID=UPI002781DAAC|nr:hypothetical protein [Streptomyces afghaniensis]MDQ1018848.1 hypothetical protein [Streptomyces afghaniensis]